MGDDEGGAVEPPAAALGRGGPEREDLRMGAGVLVALPAVAGAGDHPTLEQHHGTDGDLAGGPRPLGLLQGQPHRRVDVHVALHEVGPYRQEIRRHPANQGIGAGAATPRWLVGRCWGRPAGH